MRRLALALPTIAMLLCLVMYGVNNTAQARRQAQPPRPDQPMRSLKPMDLASMDRPEAAALRDRRQAVSRAAQIQEQQIIAQLGLSVEQMAAYSQLRQTIDEQVPAEDPAQAALNALQTAARFRDDLKQILTADQYRLYRELWDQHRGVYGSVKPDTDVNNDEDEVGSSADAPQSPG